MQPTARTTVRDAMPHLLEKARSNLAQDGYLASVLFLNQGGDLGIVPLHWPDGRAKDATVRLLKGLIGKQLISEFLLLCEAWSLEGDRAAAWDGTGSLEHHPGRGEILLAVYASPAAEEVRTAPVREEAGRKVAGPWQLMGGPPAGAYAGRFGGLWARGKANQN